MHLQNSYLVLPPETEGGKNSITYGSGATPPSCVAEHQQVKYNGELALE